MLIITAFLSSLISLIALHPVAVKFNLVDFPNERKNHIGNIPLIGGISIFLGVLISCFFDMEFDKFSKMLLFASFLMLIQGVWDDIVNLNAKTKMAFQVLLTAMLIYVTDVRLQSFGYLFGNSYSFDLGLLSIPITIIAVVGLTNAINMIDGLDGLAASLVLIAIIGLLGFNLNLSVSPLTTICIATASALLPFIIFNIVPFPKMKVFLGDGGSLFLGYIVSWSLIYNAENINNFTPSFALWCVTIPLFDFFTVIIIRKVKKHSLMIARKDHIHHFLEKLGFSKKIILLQIVSSGFIFLLLGCFVEKNFSTLSFPVFLVLFLFYLFIRIYNYSEKKIEKS